MRQKAIQGSWLCRGVDICLEHNHPLVPLWQATKPIERENIGARLSEIRPGLRVGLLDQEQFTPTPYDRLDTCLSYRTDPSWLAGQPLFAAMTFCSLLEAELRRVQNTSSDNRGAFGALFDRLEHFHHHDPSIEGFRTLLRKHVIQIWPLAARDMVLGQPLAVRKVHLVSKASQKTHSTTKVLDVLLTEALFYG